MPDPNMIPPAADALPGQTAIHGAGVAPAPARKPTRSTAALIKIPQAAFKERVRRDANAMLRAEFGLDNMEAVKARMAELEASAQSAPASDPAQSAAMQREVERAHKKAADAERAAADWEAKHRKDTRRLRDRQIESDLRLLATKAGLTDPDYALHLFAREAAAGKATSPDKFFDTLKVAPWNRAQGAPAPVAAAPVSVPATTAPPESSRPGEERPEPTPAASPTPSNNVEKMSSQEFSRHARQQYGFTPGA